jgi:hypothetical protein
MIVSLAFRGVEPGIGTVSGVQVQPGGNRLYHQRGFGQDVGTANPVFWHASARVLRKFGRSASS